MRLRISYADSRRDVTFLWGVRDMDVRETKVLFCLAVILTRHSRNQQVKFPKLEAIENREADAPEARSAPRLLTHGSGDSIVESKFGR
jgi:hypothetical protein